MFILRPSGSTLCECGEGSVGAEDIVTVLRTQPHLSRSAIKCAVSNSIEKSGKDFAHNLVKRQPVAEAASENIPATN